MKKATSLHTKLHNRDLVLRTIFTNTSISRADVARATNLTRTTVSDMVNGLLDEGLVEEVGKGESIGGKNPILLSVAADSRYLIGLNLAQNKFIGAIVNLRGEIKEKIEVTVDNNDGKKALDSVFKILDQLINQAHKPVVGIGVGAPGLINSRDGVVINAVNLDWHDLNLGELLEKKYDTPVSILNDSQASAIGEYVYSGTHVQEENYIVVNINQGIGAGILINGSLFQGDGGGAGEIGHVVAIENGELCRCGKRGCLETIASMKAILKHINHNSIEEALVAFDGNDPQTREVVLQAAHYLGISLANMIGVLNIHKIILTGDVARFGT
ncbi:MAG TPA: ROK family transcriptional regulator, partial [Anaerolineaceae bacterium]|nr:ROK family transcriptional regulator [Anaerolineaceae bacterium]